ncbi:MAG: hypothetical protein PVH19_00035 [Planctomycetia bacterium]|jgi:hypothetical protein
MRFHQPSLLYYLEQALDASFNLYAHNWTLYVVPPNAFFSWPLMQRYLIEALIQALEAPRGAPDGPQQRSLFESPPEPHCDALRGALAERSDYAEIHHIQTGRGERLEYRINLRLIQEIVIQVRREQDTLIAVKLLQGEIFMSERLLNLKLRRLYGREFSTRRCRQIMHDLVTMGLCKNNGNLRTAGREVM